MKKIGLLFLFISTLFSVQYSIIAFSTKKFSIHEAKIFLKRFPNGVIKKYTKFIEYKIEPFNSYDEAKEFLKEVKKYYKYPLIIKYNPNLGILLYPKEISYQKKLNKNKKNTNLVYCKNECGCKKNNSYVWEVSKNNILKKIDIKIKKYLNDNNNEKFNYNHKQKKTNKSVNYATVGICSFPSYSNLIYYFDIYGNYYKAQKLNYQKKGDNENIKVGFQYEKYFLNNWKFFTDNRIIFSRRKINNKINNDFYLDVNELYIRSYCLICENLDILIGRKKTRDYKSWWFDNNLDEIKLFNENNLLTFELIGATRINNNIITNENSPKIKIKNSSYIISNLNYEFLYRNNIGIYYIYEDSRPKTVFQKQRVNYIGLYSKGKKDRIKYWINIGYADGKRDYLTYSKKFNGFGIDIGAIYLLNLKNQLGINFAYGQNKFTQPLISTNYSDFLKKSFNFNYYGMIFNPVLENINILSIYWLYNISQYESLIISINNFRQIKKSIYNYNSTYLFNTNAKSTHLGEEFNVLYQYLQSKTNKFKAGLGYFIGGKAYDNLDKKNAYRIFLNYRHYWK